MSDKNSSGPIGETCRRHLDALIEGNVDVSGAVVSSTDGFEIAARVRGTQSPKKLAAMTSSLLALAEAIGQESAVGHCRDLVIDAEQGRVLLMDIPSPRHKLLLTVLCSPTATLGSVLWAARTTRESVAKDLQALAEPA